MTAALPDDRVQLRASPGGRDEAHQAIEAAIEVGLVDLQRAVRERLAASPDGAGAFQQALQSRRENGIAGIDRVLDVTDQMREADLVPQPGPAHLAAIAVGDPMNADRSRRRAGSARTAIPVPARLAARP